MTGMLRNKRSVFLERKDIVLGLGIVAAFAAALLATVIKAKYGRGDSRASEFARAGRVHGDPQAGLKILPNDYNR